MAAVYWGGSSKLLAQLVFFFFGQEAMAAIVETRLNWGAPLQIFFEKKELPHFKTCYFFMSKAKVLKGIDNTLKPAGECSYYSLLGGLKLLKKKKAWTNTTENA